MRSPTHVRGELRIQLGSGPQTRLIRVESADVSMSGIARLPTEHESVLASLEVGTLVAGELRVPGFGEVVAFAMRVFKEQSFEGSGVGLAFDWRDRDGMRQLMAAVFETRGEAIRSHDRLHPRIASDPSNPEFPGWATGSLVARPNPFGARVENISPGGALVTASPQLSLGLGDRIELSILPPNAERDFQLCGEVRRIVDRMDLDSNALRRAIGIRFDAIEGQARVDYFTMIRMIVEWIRAHSMAA